MPKKHILYSYLYEELSSKAKVKAEEEVLNAEVGFILELDMKEWDEMGLKYDEYYIETTPWFAGAHLYDANKDYFDKRLREIVSEYLFNKDGSIFYFTTTKSR